MANVVVIIPSRRHAPLVTLEENKMPRGVEVILLSDPDFYDEHREYYGQQFTVMRGVRGHMAQAVECYRIGHQRGVKYVFRPDDDVSSETLLSWDPSARKATRAKMADICLGQVEAAEALGVSLVGCANTYNPSWLSPGYRLTYGLVAGGVQLHIASDRPERYTDLRVPTNEDIYRTLAHRRVDDGYVGRISWACHDRRKSAHPKGSAYAPEDKAREWYTRELILTQFPDLVSCDGVRRINGGKQEIANWVFKRPTREQRSFWKQKLAAAART